jgi:hypothetical protein
MNAVRGPLYRCDTTVHGEEDICTDRHIPAQLVRGLAVAVMNDSRAYSAAVVPS